MGKREELIEAAKAAMLKRYCERFGRDPTEIDPSFSGIMLENATAALDAILAGLKTPSEEMLDAADMADELEGDYPDGRNRAIWQAMLSTLEETKP